MRQRLSIFLVWGCVLSVAAFDQPLPSSTTVSLSGTWDFRYVPGPLVGADLPACAPITVPGCWELQGFAAPSYAKSLKEGTGLYHRTFTVPAAWPPSDRLYLCFEGVCFGYTFAVNGKQAGSFDSAFNRAVFDITDLVNRSGTNTLDVTVVTWARGWKFDVNDDWSLSGIYREVSLFSLPPTHIQDVTVTTKMDGTVGINVAFAGPETAKAAFTSELFDAAGKIVAAGSSELKVPAPILWNAEHPYLYTLQVKTPFQTYTQKVGIREISWQGGIFKINGQRVMLRGANHHDLDPIHGRAISRDFMLKDIRLMKEGNLNFVRLSHYPPAPEFLDLCDEFGLYVIDEVPFGFGDGYLKSGTYIPDTRKRAWHTIHRDKNHPCVIIWSVGNEDPACETQLQAGKYVGELDSTRPWCFPFTPRWFRDSFTNNAYASCVPLWDVHYMPEDEYKAYAAKAPDKVFLQTEFAHAMGLDLGQVESMWETMTATPNMAGGAVWELIDQGLLMKVGAPGADMKKPMQKGTQTFYAWLDPTNYYNTSKFGGSDGVVYADRTPQVCYYQLKKVYAPVRVDFATNCAGFVIQNRYDFTDLSTLKARWELFADAKSLASGDLALSLAPHSTAMVPFPPALESAPVAVAAARYVRLTFTDSAGHEVYTRSLLFASPTPSSRIVSLAGQGAAAAPLPLLFRTGRKVNLCELDLARRHAPTFYWPQKILPLAPVPGVGAAVQVGASCDAYHSVSGTVALAAANGALTYTYDLTMHNRYTGPSKDKKVRNENGNKGKTVEAGLAFQLPKAVDTFRWLGDGPYAAYPQRTLVAEYGVWALSADDLYFPGNRRHVDLALLTDQSGVGYLFILNKADLAVERQPEGLVVGINSVLGSVYNKHVMPTGIQDTDGLRVTGTVTIIPVASDWSPALRAIFGDPSVSPKPFAPFFNSYDQ